MRQDSIIEFAKKSKGGGNAVSLKLGHVQERASFERVLPDAGLGGQMGRTSAVGYSDPCATANAMAADWDRRRIRVDSRSIRAC
jgi:hypothetical protein